MAQIQRTTSEDPDFRKLVQLLNQELALRDGDDHDFYMQFNGIEDLNHVVLAFHNNKAVACGAMKPFDKTTMEIKRMYTLDHFRGNGIAGKILKELENWALQLDMERCALETGKRQPEAIALYKKWGYSVIPNFGQYIGIDNSVCFEKILNKSL